MRNKKAEKKEWQPNQTGHNWRRTECKYQKTATIHNSLCASVSIAAHFEKATMIAFFRFFFVHTYIGRNGKLKFKHTTALMPEDNLKISFCLRIFVRAFCQHSLLGRPPFFLSCKHIRNCYIGRITSRWRMKNGCESSARNKIQSEKQWKKKRAHTQTKKLI